MMPSAPAVLANVTSKDVAAVWLNIYRRLPSRDVVKGMFICKAFKQLLSPLITEITYSEPVLDQLSFVRLANTFTNLKCFIVYQEYDDHLPLLDWSAVYLPHLEHLDLNYCPLESIEFNSANTPSLQTLCLSHQRNDIQSLKLDLTSLKTLSCSFIQVDSGANFSASIAACANLERLGGYKFWAFDGLKQKWHLPECTDIDLDRADDLCHLELWAPKLTKLALLHCHDLTYLRLLPEQGPPVKVHLPGTAQILNKKSKQHLEQHPRIGKERINYDDEEAWLNSSDDDMYMSDPDCFNPPAQDYRRTDVSQHELNNLLQQFTGLYGGPSPWDMDEFDPDYDPDAADSAEELLSDSEADTTDCSEHSEPDLEAAPSGSHVDNA